MSLYHHDPRHQRVIVRIVLPATTIPPRISPTTGSPTENDRAEPASQIVERR